MNGGGGSGSVKRNSYPVVLPGVHVWPTCTGLEACPPAPVELPTSSGESTATGRSLNVGLSASSRIIQDGDSSASASEVPATVLVNSSGSMVIAADLEEQANEDMYFAKYGKQLPTAGRFREWMLTIWQKSDVQLLVKLPHFKGCVVSQTDRTLVGQDHWHVFVEFGQPIRFSAIKRGLRSDGKAPHIERRTKTRFGCIKYCKDKGLGWEIYGDLDQHPGQRTDIEGVYERIKSGELDSSLKVMEVNPKIYAMYKGGIEAMLRTYAKGRRTKPIVWVFFGDTRSGKSTRAMAEAEKYGSGETCWLGAKKWFDGYDSQKLVIMDDFRGQMDFGDLLKALDRFPNFPEKKGSTVNFRPEKVIITSNLHPAVWYPRISDPSYAALLARFDILEEYKVVTHQPKVVAVIPQKCGEKPQGDLAPRIGIVAKIGPRDPSEDVEEGIDPGSDDSDSDLELEREEVPNEDIGSDGVSPLHVDPKLQELAYPVPVRTSRMKTAREALANEPELSREGLAKYRKFVLQFGGAEEFAAVFPQAKKQVTQWNGARGVVTSTLKTNSDDDEDETQVVDI